jgi:hypothetical protein
MLFNEQSPATIMERRLTADYKQWAMDRPNSIEGMVELALENFVEQK